MGPKATEGCFQKDILNKGNCSNHSGSSLDEDSKSRTDDVNQKQFSEYSCFVVKCLWKLNVSYRQSICKPEDQIICNQESQNWYLRPVWINFETTLWNRRVQKREGTLAQCQFKQGNLDEQGNCRSLTWTPVQAKWKNWHGTQLIKNKRTTKKQLTPITWHCGKYVSLNKYNSARLMSSQVWPVKSLVNYYMIAPDEVSPLAPCSSLITN